MANVTIVNIHRHGQNNTNLVGMHIYTMVNMHKYKFQYPDSSVCTLSLS